MIKANYALVVTGANGNLATHFIKTALEICGFLNINPPNITNFYDSINYRL